MEIMHVSEIAHSGMQYERNRVEMAALKLSLISMSFASELEARNFVSQLLDRKGLSDEFGLDLDIKAIQEDGDPLANSEGYVYRYSIDPTHEMSTLVAATRAYEANVRAYNANGQMTQSALEIGRK